MPSSDEHHTHPYGGRQAHHSGSPSHTQASVTLAAGIGLLAGMIAYAWQSTMRHRQNELQHQLEDIHYLETSPIALNPLDPCGLAIETPSTSVAMFGFLGDLFSGGKASGGAGKDPKIGRWVAGKKKVPRCEACKNKGRFECPGCSGRGRSSVNGNIMERNKCMVCQGIGLVPCDNCDRGRGGLTPEQQGIR